MLQGVRRTFGRDITNNAASASAATGKVGAPTADAGLQPKKSTTAAASFFTAPLASLASMAAAPLSAVTMQPTPALGNETEMDVDGRIHMQRAADDIDSRDNGNPLLCTAYVNEMYNIFFDAERQEQRVQTGVNPSGYMVNQPHINEKMRAILIDWLVEVHLKFKMVPESLYLTVNLIDRYLAVKTVRRSKLQLVGVACLMVSLKMLFALCSLLFAS